MKTTVEMETERPEELVNILRPSLTSDKKIQYQLETGEDLVTITVETEGLGQLRGCTDTVFRLSTLAKKLY